MSDRNNEPNKKKVSSARFESSPQTGSDLSTSLKAQTAEVPSANATSATALAADTVAKLPANGAPPPLDCAPLAYENPTFLNSPDGRLIRIVAEYMEPLARFRHERIQDTVVFFGSARFRARKKPTTNWSCSITPVPRVPHLVRSSRPSRPRSPQVRRPTCSASAPWLL